jgi:hypothetical protein
MTFTTITSLDVLSELLLERKIPDTLLFTKVYCLAKELKFLLVHFTAAETHNGQEANFPSFQCLQGLLAVIKHKRQRTSSLSSTPTTSR